MTRHIRNVLVAAGVLFGVAVVGASSAYAIDRVACTSSNDSYKSNATTCWANPGGTSVALYSVYGHHSGNNAGCHTSLTYYNGKFVTTKAYRFVKWVDFNNDPGVTDTVQFIYHSADGQPSNICATQGDRDACTSFTSTLSYGSNYGCPRAIGRLRGATQ